MAALYQYLAIKFHQSSFIDCYLHPHSPFFLLLLPITVIKRLAYKLISTEVNLRIFIISDVSKIISCLRGNIWSPLRNQSNNVI